MYQKAKKQLHIGNFSHTDFIFPGSTEIFASFEKHIILGQKYIIAVSGGSDSMLLACLVYKFWEEKKLGLQNLIFIHCNHAVRTESYQESEFLKQFFTGTHFQLVTRKEKISKINEENLRKRRYAQFVKVAKKHNATRLIVGHNLTDRIESTFLHLLRGAHLKGFLAMSQYEKHHIFPGNIYRPLLNISKEHILTICKKYHIPYSTDKSNFDPKTSLRNKLRMEVLTGLYKLAHKTSPNENSFQQSMLHLYKELEKTTQKKTFSLTPFTACSLRKAKFAYEVSATSSRRTNETTVQILRELKITHNMSLAQIRELTKFFSTAEQGFKYLQGVYFFIAHKKMYAIHAPLNFRQQSIEKSKNILTLGQVKRYNFTLPIVKKERIGGSIRFAKASDRYHNKTRNQYCITAKIPVFWRNFVPVVVKGGKIMNVFREMI